MKTYSVYSDFLDQSFIVITDGDPSKLIYDEKLVFYSEEEGFTDELNIDELVEGIHETRDLF